MSLVPTLSSLGFPLHAALYCSYRAYWLSDGDVHETRHSAQEETGNDPAALSGVLTRAVKMGKLETNPVRNVDKPRIDRRPKVRYLSADEESRLRTALIQRDQEGLLARKSANEWRRARGRDLLREPERMIGGRTRPTASASSPCRRASRRLGARYSSMRE